MNWAALSPLPGLYKWVEGQSVLSGLNLKRCWPSPKLSPRSLSGTSSFLKTNLRMGWELFSSQPHRFSYHLNSKGISGQRCSGQEEWRRGRCGRGASGGLSSQGRLGKTRGGQFGWSDASFPLAFSMEGARPALNCIPGSSRGWLVPRSCSWVTGMETCHSGPCWLCNYSNALLIIQSSLLALITGIINTLC